MPAHDIYSFSLKTLDGKDFRFDAFRGKKMLIVNTASECGFTPQYAQLQELHESFGNKVEIIGIPCNDFGGQEPGGPQQIREFCTKNYGVTFTLLEKVHTTGESAHPLFKWLSDKSLNGVNDIHPQWNFGKYLIGKDGKLMRYFAPVTSPFDEELMALIQS